MNQSKSSAVSRPAVSIVMSAYNDGQWLHETIAAILAQTHANFECLIIDDASTDDTPSILAGVADPRLMVIRHDSRMGWLNSINKLAAMARGRLIKLHCPDDVMLPEGLSRAVAYFDAHPEVGYIFSDWYFVDEAGRRMTNHHVRQYNELIPGPEADRIALRDGCFANTSCLYVPRDKWIEMGGFRDVTAHNPLRLPTVEDYELMVRLQEFYPAGCISEQLVAVRAHPAQVQANPSAKALSVEGALYVYKAVSERILLSDKSAQKAVYWELRAKIASSHLNAAIKDFLKGDRLGARTSLAAIRHQHSLSALALPWLTTVALPALGRRIARPLSKLPGGTAIATKLRAWIC